jgi:hypothetical protein
MDSPENEEYYETTSGDSRDSVDLSDYIFETMDELRELNSNTPGIFDNLTYTILTKYVNYIDMLSDYMTEKTRIELFKDNLTHTQERINKRFVEQNPRIIDENYRLFKRKFNTRKNSVDYNEFVLFLVKHSYKFYW